MAEQDAQEHRNALDLALLLQASSLLSASLEPQVVIDRLTQLLAKAADADLVSLFMIEDQLVRCISVYGPWLDPKLLAHFALLEVAPWAQHPHAARLKEMERAVTGPVQDVELDPELRAEMSRAGIKSFAVLPLLHRGVLVGIAHVYTSDLPPGLDSGTLALLQALANQAATALEQARLYHALKEHAVTLERQVALQTAELTQRNRQLLALNETLVAVNESLDLEETLVVVTERLQCLLSVHECTLYLLEDNSAELSVVSHVSEGLPALLVAEQVLRGSELWRRLEGADGALSLSLDELQPFLAEGRMGHDAKVVIFSLRARGELLGLVLLRGLQYGTWTHSGDFWRALGDQIGLAVQNTRLHQAAQERAERLRILLEIGRDLNSSLNLQKVLDRAVFAIHEYVPDVHNCAISFLEDEGRRLRNVSQWQRSHQDQIRALGERALVKDLKESRVALETGHPVMVWDLWRDPSLSTQERDQLQRGGVRALLYVPILGKDGPMGLIHVNVFQEPRVFASHEIELLQGIAAQLALALENVRLLEMVQAHAAAAQARAQELDTFTYTVSHDLKAPLSNLQGFAQVLVEDYAEVLDEQGRQCLDRIAINAQLMAQMIDELLLLTRLDRDERPPEPVDLGHLLVGILLQLYPEIQEQRVKLKISEDMPTVLGHEVWLEQVFMNLISNAIKFIDDNHPDPLIEIGWERKAEGALFWVQDNGVGIAKEDQERVFDLFTRLHTVRRKGTGLGLAIVRQVVERAHGRIWVESEGVPGKGSRFCFTWPAVI